MSEYHVVIGADGKPDEIAVAGPSASGWTRARSIPSARPNLSRQSKTASRFAVLLDLDVQFRIYSKRTAVASNPALEQASAAPVARTV